MSDAWGAETTWDGEVIPPSRLTKTHDLRPGERFRALDAKVLAYMNYEGQVITTPNADWVPEYPLITEAGILKRDNGLWGGHEYSRWPQFFSKHAFHHACIPFHKEPMTWHFADEGLLYYKPQIGRDDFCDATDPDLRMDVKVGLLRKEMVNALRIKLETVAANVFCVGQRADIPGTRKVYDRCLSRARSGLDSLRLRKSSFRTILFTVRDIQRLVLELQGLHTYLDVVINRMNTANELWKTEGFLLPVRGAFTTEAPVAENLFRLGIPVWYISAEKAITPDTKIFSVQECVPWTSQMSKEYAKLNGKTLLVRWNLDVEPRMRDMAASQLMNHDHMSQLLDQMYNFQYYGPAPFAVGRSSASPPTAASSSSSTYSARPPPLAAAVPPPQPPPSTSKRGKGGLSRKIANEPSVNHARILYVPNGVDGTPDLPPFCYQVHQALKDLGTVGNDSSPAALYPLPPPFFLTHESPEKSADLYLNYIRIRPVLFDILIKGGLFDKSVWRKLRDWRNILHGDYKKSTPLPPNTVSPFVEGVYNSMPGISRSPDALKASDCSERDSSDLPPAKRQRLTDNATMKVMFGVERNLEPFDRTKVQTWRGKSVSASNILQDKVLRQEVQWELAETLFRYELYALDQAILPRSRMTTDEHRRQNALLSRVYMGATDGSTTVIPDLSKPQREYWGDDVLERDSLDALRDVLRAWPNCPETLSREGDMIPKDFRIMIPFYVKTFSQIFNRIPSMHCIPPKSLIKST